MPSIEQSTMPKGSESMYEPVEQSIPQSGFTSQPSFPSYNSFLATPLPLISTYQPDALRQFYRGGVPQQRIFPVG